MSSRPVSSQTPKTTITTPTTSAFVAVPCVVRPPEPTPTVAACRSARSAEIDAVVL